MAYLVREGEGVKEDTPPQVADIKEARAKKKDCPEERFVVRKKPKPKWYDDDDVCHHKSTLLNDELRTITCVNCGAALDPISVLVGWLDEDQSFKYDLQRRQEFIREVYQAGTKKANKQYECAICDKDIKRGDKYYRKTWSKVCCPCVERGLRLQEGKVKP